MKLLFEGEKENAQVNVNLESRVYFIHFCVHLTFVSSVFENKNENGLSVWRSQPFCTKCRLQNNNVKKRLFLTLKYICTTKKLIEIYYFQHETININKRCFQCTNTLGSL